MSSSDSYHSLSGATPSPTRDSARLLASTRLTALAAWGWFLFGGAIFTVCCFTAAVGSTTIAATAPDAGPDALAAAIPILIGAVISIYVGAITAFTMTRAVSSSHKSHAVIQGGWLGSVIVLSAVLVPMLQVVVFEISHPNRPQNSNGGHNPIYSDSFDKTAKTMLIPLTIGLGVLYLVPLLCSLYASCRLLYSTDGLPSPSEVPLDAPQTLHGASRVVVVTPGAVVGSVNDGAQDATSPIAPPEYD